LALKTADRQLHGDLRKRGFSEGRAVEGRAVGGDVCGGDVAESLL
jgi:hypothetical protein